MKSSTQTLVRTLIVSVVSIIVPVILFILKYVSVIKIPVDYSDDYIILAVGASIALAAIVLQHYSDTNREQIEAAMSKRRITLFEKGVEANYQTAEHLIRSAPKGSYIYLTGIAPTNPHDKEQERYRKERENKIQKGDCYFQRIVTIHGENDLERLKNHIKEHEGKREKYELRILDAVLKSEIPAPYFECLIVHRPDNAMEALLRIPPAGPHLANLAALHLVDAEIVEALRQYFLHLWEESNWLLTDGRLNKKLMAELEESVRSQANSLNNVPKSKNKKRLVMTTKS